MKVMQHFKMEMLDWDITIYYTVNEKQKIEIEEELRATDCDEETLKSIVNNLTRAKINTGFTYSNYKRKYSIVVVHKASSIGEFINTFEHEKNHLEMQICEALNINPYSEDAAHLSGDLSQVILEKALNNIIEL